MKLENQKSEVRGQRSGIRSQKSGISRLRKATPRQGGRRFGVMCLIMSLLVSFAMVGCTGTQIQIDQDSKEVIAKIAGRRAGAELAKEYPNIADQVNTVCQEIITQEEPDLISIAVDSLFAVLAVALADEIDDPFLAADIVDILSLIKIKPGIEITESQMAVIKAAAEGLISGIEIQAL